MGSPWGSGAPRKARRKPCSCALLPVKSPPTSTALWPGSAGCLGGRDEMSQVAVTVNGRPYKITCDDGQEPRIRRLAQYVDGRVGEFVKGIGQVGEARLLLL